MGGPRAVSYIHAQHSIIFSALFFRSVFSLKMSQRPVKYSTCMGPRIKFAAKKLQHFFATCEWKMLLVAPELNF